MKAKFSSQNISVIKFENHKIPEFKEVRGKEWVLYGEKNDYPDYLISNFTKSAKHNAILTGKTQYIAGNGWTIDNGGLNTEKVAILQSFVDKANPGETLNDILLKAALDLELFGGFALEIIWGKAGAKIAEIHHFDFNKLRSNIDGTKFFYSNDWSKYNPEKEKDFAVYNAFDVNKPVGKQVLYVKSYRPKAEVYPLPDYIGCMPYIEIDYEIANFHLNNIKNSFWGSYLINFNNGIPTPEEQKEIEKKIKNKYTGSDNAGRFVLNFSDSKEKAPELLSLTPSELDKQFDILNKTVQQEIFVGHKINNPMLFGIKTEGQLGGRTELVEAAELFQNVYVNHKQKILENIFNNLAKVNGFEGRLKIQPTEPIGMVFSEATLTSVMSRAEIREKAGLPKENTAMRSQFSKEDDNKLIQLFSQYGEPSENFEVLKSKKIWFTSDKECLESEIDLYKTNFATPLEINLKPTDKAVLDILKKDPLISITDIAKALKIDSEKVLKAIDNLSAEGILDVSGDEIKITPEGKATIEDQPAITEIFIKYKYEVAPGLGLPIIKTTRDFCRDLIHKDRMYDRKDIETISNQAGYSVWQNRGGFYHNPKTNETTPYCRHIWTQNIVKRKK